MELLTKEIEARFKKFPYGSQDGKWMEAEVLVKYFNPVGAGTWIITEAEQEGDDWILYGFCSIGYGYEFGPVSLNELKSIRVLGLGIERDLCLKDNCRVCDLISESDLM